MVILSLLLGINAMPVIGFEGQQHRFPDDFTQEEIAAALGGARPEATEVVDTEEGLQQEADGLFAIASAKVQAVGFEEAVAYTIGIEGKEYVSDPDDAGGETKLGISKRSYPDEDISAMTEERAKELYRRDFWDKQKLGKLPDRLATKVFDTGVNIGPKRGVMLLQSILGVKVTGVVDEATQDAVEKHDEDKLLSTYVKDLRKYYKEVAKRGNNKKFLNGWLARADKLPEVVEEQPVKEQAMQEPELKPARAGLFENDDGVLFLVDEAGNIKEL